MIIKPLTANLPSGHVRFFSIGPRLPVSSLILIAISFLFSVSSFSAGVGETEHRKAIKIPLPIHAPRPTHHVPTHA
jgi:hypothetical protein